MLAVAMGLVWPPHMCVYQIVEFESTCCFLSRHLRAVARKAMHCWTGPLSLHLHHLACKFALALRHSLRPHTVNDENSDTHTCAAAVPHELRAP